MREKEDFLIPLMREESKNFNYFVKKLLYSSRQAHLKYW